MLLVMNATRPFEVQEKQLAVTTERPLSHRLLKSKYIKMNRHQSYCRILLLTVISAWFLCLNKCKRRHGGPLKKSRTSLAQIDACGGREGWGVRCPAGRASRRGRGRWGAAITAPQAIICLVEEVELNTKNKKHPKGFLCSSSVVGKPAFLLSFFWPKGGCETKQLKNRRKNKKGFD